MAPFLDGALVYDTVTQCGHVVDRLGQLLLEDGGSTAPAETGDLAADRVIHSAVERLRSLGLLDRTEGSPTPITRSGSPDPARDRLRGRTHVVLDQTIAFRSRDRGLLAEVDEFLGGGSGDIRSTLCFDLDVLPGGGVLLRTDEEWRFPRESALYAQLPGILNEYASMSDELLALHAGAVITPDGTAAVMPGRSGAGKSTITAALLQLGCAYLTDEVAGLLPGRPCPALRSFPKPLTLDAPSCSVLGLDGHDRRPHVSPGTIRPGVHIRSSVDEPSLRFVVPDFRPDCDLNWRKLEPVEAVQALLLSTFNLVRIGQPGLCQIAAMAESVPVHHLQYSDATVAARSLLTRPL
jgi:hypothetical protein